MPFKGVVLGASAYGDLATRPAGDLDVLIDRRYSGASRCSAGGPGLRTEDAG